MNSHTRVSQANYNGFYGPATQMQPFMGALTYPTAFAISRNNQYVIVVVHADGITMEEFPYFDPSQMQQVFHVVPQPQQMNGYVAQNLESTPQTFSPGTHN